jgi:hypothetical protein
MNTRSVALASLISAGTLAVAVGGFSLLATSSGCSTSDDGKKCTLEANLSRSVCSVSNGAAAFTTSINNPFFPLSPGNVRGRQWVLEGKEDGELVKLVIDVRPTAEDKVVSGVRTVVMTETEYENNNLVEVSYNYFAQAVADGSVCYFGEAVDDYENGVIVSHEGAWLAGEGVNDAGIIMPGSPQMGQVYEQEYAPDIAQDMAEIVATGEQWVVRLGTYTDTLSTNECTPLEKGSGEDKASARNIGLIYDNGVELISINFTP